MACSTTPQQQLPSTVKERLAASNKPKKLKTKRKIGAMSPELYQQVKLIRPKTERYTIEEGYMGDQELFNQNKVNIQALRNLITGSEKLNSFEESTLLYYLAKSHKNLGELDNAISTYKKIIALSPNIPIGNEIQAYKNIAEIYLDQKKFLQAESTLKQLKREIEKYNAISTRYKKDFPKQANVMLAKIAMHHGNTDEARQLLEPVLCQQDCQTFEIEEPASYFELLKKIYLALGAKHPKKYSTRIEAIEMLVKQKPYTILYKEAYRPIVIPSSEPRHGKCSFNFDINTKGKAENAKVVACISKFHETFGQRALANFVFQPAVDKNGNLQTMENLFYEFSF